MYSYDDRIRAVELYIKLGSTRQLRCSANVLHRPVESARYRWPGWLSRIADAKLIRSMSRKGYSPDSAACEGFFGRLKTELFYPRNWLSTTIEQFIQAVDSYIRWYNERRIKISHGSLSPSNTERVLDLRHKTSPSFYPHPHR